MDKAIDLDEIKWPPVSIVSVAFITTVEKDPVSKKITHRKFVSLSEFQEYLLSLKGGDGGE